MLAVMLVLTAAFLAGSFAARNSDLWRHLAAGRGLLDGAYALGSDPFSYTGADRPWVNGSWLYDATSYLIYSADATGAALVAIKALGFALAFGLPMLLRRPGQPLWPWPVVAAIGILAAAPMAHLRPTVASMAFLAATLYLVHCCPWRPGSWRKPAYLAGLFLVWANVDEWFFLGPLALALMLAGGLIDRYLLGDVPADPDPDDPFPPTPPVAGLAKALLLGVAASLLNPTLLIAMTRDPGEAAAQLVPVELGWTMPAGAAADDTVQVLTLSPISEGYADEPTRGYNLNGLMAAVLLVGGAVVLAAGYARLRATHILLWIGFAALALQSYRLIPFFAVVAVPLAAGHLSGLAGRARLGPKASPGTQILLTGAIVGRLLMAVAAVGMVLAAWPGWLHTNRFESDPGLADAVTWAVEPDMGLARTAAWVERRRTADAGPALPADARGLQSQPRFGDYCAWFAPSEKVFVNSRYLFHRTEVADLATVRAAVESAKQADSEATFDAAIGQLNEVCEQYKIDYLVFSSIDRPVDLQAVMMLITDRSAWDIWHLDGRSAVLGRPGSAGADRLRFDPVRLAFGPDIEPIPAHRASPPPPTERDAFQAYVARPELPSHWADDALVYTDFANVLQSRAERDWQARQQAMISPRAAVVGYAGANWIVTPPPAAPDATIALPLLAVQAARRAIAATPDRPEGYRALGVAYSGQRVPTADPTLPTLQAITARAMYLARMPPPTSAGTTDALNAADAARQLAQLYQQTGQLDLAREAVKSAIAYVERIVATDPGVFLRRFPPGEKIDDLSKTVLQSLGLTQLDNRITEIVQTQNDKYQTALARGNPSAPQKFNLALQLGFPGRAIELFTSAADDDFEEAGADANLRLIEAELKAGRLAQAVVDLDQLNTLLADAPNPDPRITASVNNLKILAAQLQGDEEAAGEILRDQSADLRPLTPDAIRLARPSAANATGAAAGALMFRIQFDSTAPIRNELANESAYSFTRGVLALLGGSPADAHQWFERTRSPQGVDVTELNVPNRAGDAAVYLRLIDAANRTPEPR